MSIDRLAEGYQPDFDIDAAVGRQGELLVNSVIAALRDGTAEVKTDERAAQTGNVYVEWSCLRRNAWHPSGIAATKADVWAVVIGRVVIVAPREVVLEAAREAYREGRRVACTVGSHPTQGVTLPIDSLIRRYMAADQAKAA